MSKKDIINKAIQYMSPANLELANKKYGTNYSKDELYLEEHDPEKGKPETFCVHVTDLHYGKKTEAGNKSYNPDVCMLRTLDYIKNLRELSKIEHRSRNFATFAILDTGDMLDGMGIYPTQAAGHTALPNLNHQIEGVIEYFYRPLIKFGLENFPRVLICKVPGNHGRLGKFQSEGSNLDCMVTTTLRIAFNGHENVKIVGNDEMQRSFDVDGHRVLLFHGDGKNMRSFHGLPWYSINKSTLGWSFLDDLDFELALMGHFHQCFDMPIMMSKGRMVMMSGTMVTADDFSIKNYQSDGDHRWWCFGLHPDRKGTTFQYKVDLVKES